MNPVRNSKNKQDYNSMSPQKQNKVSNGVKILFTGGGTGGHIFPIIAIVREIKKGYPRGEFQFFFLGPKDKWATSFLEKEGIKPKFILAGKIRRYFSILAFFQNLVDVLIKSPIGFFQGFWYVFFLNPDIIFSKGGYGSLSAVISGRILQVPIFLHESDVSPGLANRLISRWALEIFVSFPVEKTEYFPKEKMISVGNPIRKEILGGSKEKAQKLFQLREGKPIILILGGSQGAKKINDILILILAQLLKDFELIHQTGWKNYREISIQSKALLAQEFLSYYHLLPFLNEKELAQALAASDLVIGRAGSGTIFEIAALGKPAILIPLPGAAQSHQLKNAYSYTQSGAAIVIEQVNLTPRFLLGQIKNLFILPEILKTMAKAAQQFSRPEAGKIIANYLVEYLTQ